MANPTYVVHINLTKDLKVNVKAASSKEAEEKAVAALREQLKDSGLEFKIYSSCYDIKVDPKKFYVETILIDDHPDIMSVAEYFEEAGFFEIPEHACCGETLCFWLAEQPSFELDGYDVTLVRVGHLWSAVVHSVSDKPKVPVTKIEEHMAKYLATAKTLPNGSKNPVKGSVPVSPGSADDASRQSKDKEVVQF